MPTLKTKKRVIWILNTVTIVCTLLAIYYVGVTFYYLHEAHQFNEELKKYQRPSSVTTPTLNRVH